MSQFVIDDKTIPTAVRSTLARWRIIMRILHQVQSNGMIEKFKLSAYCSPDRSEFFQWVKFFADKGLKELILKESAFINFGHCKLPDSLFTCPKLKCLELSSCMVNPPLEILIGYKFLTSLQLNKVCISRCALERLVLKCPLLERLTLLHLTNSIFLKIQNPNLKYLEIHSKFEDVSLANTSSLLSVSISWRGWEKDNAHNHGESDLSGILGHLHVIERLTLLSSFFQFLDHEVPGRLPKTVPYRLPSHLHRLTDLKLKDLMLDSISQVKYCLCLLRSAPNLEKLQLVIVETYSEPVKAYLEAGSVSPHWKLHRLHPLKISAICGFDTESILTKFIMDQSPNVKHVDILHY